jgi:beta-phosphoglucomutase
VQASKPDPESYALAVAGLSSMYPDRKIVPGLCLAIEDTPAGIASAMGAGLKVLAVTNSYPEENLAVADKVIATLAGVELDNLRQLF